MLRGVKLAFACLTAGMLVYGCSKGTDEQQAIISGTDLRFVMMASMNNFTEVQLGQLASDSGESESITAFGDQMVMDHATANSELKQISGPLNLHAPDSMDAAHVALRDQLLALSGRSFDSVYIHNQVADHQVALHLFLDQAQSGRYKTLRDFAREKVPVLQMHLQEAMNLAAAY